MIDLEHDHGVAVIRMHESRAFERDCGALVPGTLEKITAALEYLGASHAVVLTGGADVFARGFAGGATEELERAVLAIAHHPTPVVAAIGGDALGAGYALAAAADLRVMSGGRLGLGAGRSRGVPLSAPVEAVLRTHAGPAWRALGSAATPEAALAAGLVETWCAPRDLLRVAVERAARLAGGAKQLC